MIVVEKFEIGKVVLSGIYLFEYKNLSLAEREKKDVRFAEDANPSVRTRELEKRRRRGRGGVG